MTIQYIYSDVRCADGGIPFIHRILLSWWDQWCRNNDDKCREIAANAARLYDRYCAKEGILDYLEVMTHKIAENWREVPEWWDPPIISLRKPQGDIDHAKDCNCTRYVGTCNCVCSGGVLF